MGTDAFTRVELRCAGKRSYPTSHWFFYSSLVRALRRLRAPFRGQNPCALLGRLLNQDTHLGVAWLHVDVHAVV